MRPPQQATLPFNAFYNMLPTAGLPGQTGCSPQSFPGTGELYFDGTLTKPVRH